MDRVSYDLADTARRTLIDHKANTSNPHGVTQTQVGLPNVDNTSDADKPISTSTQTALNLKSDLTLISNMDNTSDLDKPVSTASQTALDLKSDKANVLELNNTDVYAPGSAYHPATKAYVDSQVTSGGGNVALTKIEEFVSTGAVSEVYTTSSGYIVGAVSLTFNGVELSSDEYTAGDASTFTLTLDASVGDVLRFTIYGGADVYNKTQADARYEPIDSNIVKSTESGALHSTDALRISGQTLSLYKGDDSNEDITIPSYTLPSSVVHETEYASSTSGGTVKMRVSGGVLYLRNDGIDA